MKILIIEDEAGIAEVEKAYVEREGYAAETAQDGIEGLSKFSRDKFDLVILDLMLPGMAGIDVCREIRRNSNAPIIMVTAKSGEEDIVAGLDAGADDYVVKPFSPRVLMARVRANLRHGGTAATEATGARATGSGTAGSNGKVIRFGSSFEIDTENYTVVKDGHEIKMTRNEFMILSKMAQHPGRTWSREDIITYALGYEYDGFDRSIDSYIKNIRKKLGDTDAFCIKTVHGFGYKLCRTDENPK